MTDGNEMPDEIYAQGKYWEGGYCKIIAHLNSFHDDKNTKYIREDIITTQRNTLLFEVLESLDAKIRQKKGFYTISVGNDEVRRAHKAGVLKGLDAVREEIKAILSDKNKFEYEEEKNDQC